MSDSQPSSHEAAKRELDEIEARIKAACADVDNTDENIDELEAMREELLARLGGASVAEADEIGDDVKRG